jgi:Zn-dependent protease
MGTLILLLTKLKFLKVLLSVGTIVLAIATYALVFGWPFAIGFVFLILCHEMGHYIAARQRGLAVSLPMFIPFLGAYIALKDQPHDAETEAYVAYAGPFVGSLACFGAYFLSRHYDSTLLLALAQSGFMINLFNLIPVSPLDGGRITAVLSPRVWLLGLPILVAFWFYHPSPLLVLIGLMALPHLMQAWRYDASAPANRAYYGVSLATKIEYAGLYLVLVLVLAILSNILHEELLRRLSGA